jgi:hypothetical protein
VRGIQATGAGAKPRTVVVVAAPSNPSAVVKTAKVNFIWIGLFGKLRRRQTNKVTDRLSEGASW